MDQAPRERPWLPWAIGSLLLLLGFAAGWFGLSLPLRRLSAMAPSEAVSAHAPRPALTNQAQVIGPAPELAGRVGAQVYVAFGVLNTGTASWPADLFRFVPVDAGPVTVIPLPGAVAPGEFVWVGAHLWVPPVSSPWVPAWELRGPDGPVAGGRLEARITVLSAAEGEAGP